MKVVIGSLKKPKGACKMGTFTADAIDNLLEGRMKLAYEKVPKERPLVFHTKYSRSILEKDEVLFHIYYGGYGQGKTFSALKVYHETLNGEYKDKYDVILINMRENFEEFYNQVKNFTRIRARNTSFEIFGTLILSSLGIGMFSDVCSPEVEGNCWSTYQARDEYKGRLNEVKPLLQAIERLDAGSLKNLIEVSLRKTLNTDRKPIIILDEFESVLEGGVFYGVTLRELLESVGTSLRRMYDIGARSPKVVFLIQQNILQPRQLGDLESLNDPAKAPYRFKAALGITEVNQVKYDAEDYFNFVVESMRLILTTVDVRCGFVSINNGKVEIKPTLKQEIKNVINKIFANLPPRISIPGLRRVVAFTFAELCKGQIRLSNRIVKEAINKAIESFVGQSTCLKVYTSYVANPMYSNLFEEKSRDIVADLLNLLIDRIKTELKGVRRSLFGAFSKIVIGGFLFDNKVVLIWPAVNISIYASPRTLSGNLFTAMNKALGEVRYSSNINTLTFLVLVPTQQRGISAKLENAIEETLNFYDNFKVRHVKEIALDPLEMTALACMVKHKGMLPKASAFYAPRSFEELIAAVFENLITRIKKSVEV